MSRKIFWLPLCALLLALGFPAHAQQQRKVPRIGFVDSSGDPSSPSLFVVREAT